MNNFMSWLSKNDKQAHSQLSRYKVGSSGFDSTWKALAKSGSFAQSQHNFIKASHYDPVVSKIKGTLDVSKYPSAVKDMIWSIGVQHGTGGASSLIKNAGVTTGMNAAEVIRRVYTERMKVDKYFSRSSAAIKASVKKRFQNEMNDALRMLG